MEQAIQLKQLRKEFQGKRAVDDISLMVEEGIVFSLLGVNGAGKTTTLRMLMGLLRPTKGEAYVFGKSILTSIREIQKFSNSSPQETAVSGNLTVEENLMFLARIYGSHKEEAKNRARQVMKELSLEEVRGRRAKLLSGGFQRRLSIAMALITKPRILYLDEPTLGLDVLARRELWKVIQGLKGSTTIILTTHYMEEAEYLSDRIGIMIDGKIRAVGTKEELYQATGTKNLEEAFLCIAEVEYE